MNEIAIRRIMLFGLSGVFLGLISQLTKVDLDLFHEMALFREVIKSGTFPRTDIFSYISTVNPVVHHEWGAGAILYLLTVKAGLGAYGLLMLKYLVTALICTGIYLFAKRQGASDYAFSIMAFLGIALGWVFFTTIRAQVFSLMFLVILLLLIEEDRRGKKWPLWVWLPMHVIWVNMHGGFLMGLGLLSIYIMELFLFSLGQEKKLFESLKKVKFHLTIFVALCFLTLLNPYGMAYIPYIWHAVSLDRTQFIEEWRPIWQVDFYTLINFLLSLIVLLYIMSRQKDILRVPGVLILGVTALLAARHFRHVSIYAVAFLCYVPVYLEKSYLSNPIKRTWNSFHKILCALFIVIGVLGLAFAVWNKFWETRVPSVKSSRDRLVYPVGAVNYLRDLKFAGNMMVPYNEGSYVSWNLYPNVKVSMDSRFEVAYSVDQVAENMNFYAAREGWQDTLAKYRTDAVLVPRWKEIDKHLSQSGLTDWTRVYIDDGYAIYMRPDLAKNYPASDMRGCKIVGTFP